MPPKKSKVQSPCRKTLRSRRVNTNIQPLSSIEITIKNNKITDMNTKTKVEVPEKLSKKELNIILANEVVKAAFSQKAERVKEAVESTPLKKIKRKKTLPAKSVSKKTNICKINDSSADPVDEKERKELPESSKTLNEFKTTNKTVLPSSPAMEDNKKCQNEPKPNKPPLRLTRNKTELPKCYEDINIINNAEKVYKSKDVIKRKLPQKSTIVNKPFLKRRKVMSDNVNDNNDLKEENIITETIRPSQENGTPIDISIPKKNQNISVMRRTSSASELSWTKDISSCSTTTCITVSSNDVYRIDKKLPIVKLTDLNQYNKKEGNFTSIKDKYLYENNQTEEKSSLAGLLDLPDHLNLSSSSSDSASNLDNKSICKKIPERTVINSNVNEDYLKKLSSNLKRIDLDMIVWIGNTNNDDDYYKDKVKSFKEHLFKSNVLQEEKKLLQHCRAIQRLFRKYNSLEVAEDTSIDDQDKVEQLPDMRTVTEEQNVDKVENCNTINGQTNKSKNCTVTQNADLHFIEPRASIIQPKSRNKNCHDANSFISNEILIRNNSGNDCLALNNNNGKCVDDNDDDDALSLFAESITGLDSSKRNSSLQRISVSQQPDDCVSDFNGTSFDSSRINNETRCISNYQQSDQHVRDFITPDLYSSKCNDFSHRMATREDKDISSDFIPGSVELSKIDKLVRHVDNLQRTDCVKNVTSGELKSIKKNYSAPRNGEKDQSKELTLSPELESPVKFSKNSHRVEDAIPGNLNPSNINDSQRNQSEENGAVFLPSALDSSTRNNSIRHIPDNKSVKENAPNFISYQLYSPKNNNLVPEYVSNKSSEEYIPDYVSAKPIILSTYNPTKIANGDREHRERNNDYIVGNICEKQNADSTSIYKEKDGDINVHKKPIIYEDRRGNFEEKMNTCKNADKPNNITRLIGNDNHSVPFDRSLVYKGVCFHNLKNTCPYRYCKFPHKLLTAAEVKQRLLILGDVSFKREYMLTRQHPELLCTYGLCFVDECIKRKSTRTLLIMAIDFISLMNDEIKAQHNLKTFVVEKMLLYLNNEFLSTYADYLQYKVIDEISLCDVFLKTIAESQNFTRFIQIFISLIKFISSINQRFDVEVATHLLERVCILPYNDKLARAIIDVIKMTEDSIFANDMIVKFEGLLYSSNIILYEEFLFLKNRKILSVGNQLVRDTFDKSFASRGLETSGNGMSLIETDTRYSPDTTHDNLNKKLEPIFTRTLGKNNRYLSEPVDDWTPTPTLLNTSVHANDDRGHCPSRGSHATASRLRDGNGKNCGMSRNSPIRGNFKQHLDLNTSYNIGTLIEPKFTRTIGMKKIIFSNTDTPIPSNSSSGSEDFGMQRSRGLFPSRIPPFTHRMDSTAHGSSPQNMKRPAF